VTHPGMMKNLDMEWIAWECRRQFGKILTLFGKKIQLFTLINVSSGIFN